jgi:hypothetical protein
MRAYKTAALLTIVFLFPVTPSTGQSLGDVARQQRQKQQAKDKDAHPAAKVITNEDLPAHSDSDSTAATKDKEKHGDASSSTGVGEYPTPGTPSDPNAAAQWKATIQAQKNVIDSLQAEIEKVNDSIRFVQANRYSNGVEYNEYQVKKQQEVERLKKQMEGEKKKLEDLQESARKAGFGSAVYEP